MILRFAGVLLVVAMLTGCSVGIDNSNQQGEAPMATNNNGAVVWDFRRPLTTLDLGSTSGDIASIEGPVELEVIFPSGRSISRNLRWGALANPVGGPNFGEGPAQPVDQIALDEGSVDNVDDVRASAEQFIAEFGPATRGANGMSLTDYLDEFEAIVDANNGTISPRGHGTGADGLGSTIRAFVAEDQDGFTASLLVRVKSDSVTLRTSIRFEPAPNP